MGMKSIARGPRSVNFSDVVAHEKNGDYTCCTWHTLCATPLRIQPKCRADALDFFSIIIAAEQHPTTARPKGGGRSYEQKGA
jgi:hypothetical protein